MDTNTATRRDGWLVGALTLFVVAQAADIVTTWFDLYTLHRPEANPVVALLLAHVGLRLYLVAKVVAALLAVGCMLWIAPSFPRMARIGAYVLAAMTLGVVIALNIVPDLVLLLLLHH